MKKKSSFIYAAIKFGTEPIFLIITTVTTVIFGVLINLFDNSTTLYHVCDRGFYISLSLILVQLILQQTELKQNTGKILTNIKTNKNIIFAQEKAHLNELFEAQLNNLSANTVKIICYGTNAYGKYLEYIITKCEHIKNLELIVCSPDNNLVSSHGIDKIKINNTLKETSILVEEYNSNQKKNKKKISIYCTELIPTIRASIIYSNANKPMWCTMQAYRLYSGEGSLLRGEGLTPSFVATDENSDIISDLALAFEEEFFRLKQSGKDFSTPN